MAIPLIFPYGEMLPTPDPSMIAVSITTQTDHNGKVTAAQLNVTFPIKPAGFRFAQPDPQGNYPLSLNEIGCPNPSALHDDQAGTDELSVTFDGALAYLNLCLPLANPKKDYGE